VGQVATAERFLVPGRTARVEARCEALGAQTTEARGALSTDGVTVGLHGLGSDDCDYSVCLRPCRS
jgi:hypothetical protein